MKIGKRVYTMEASINNYTFVGVEEKVCEFCGSINSYDENNTCRHCGGNKYKINKVKVKNLKPTPKPTTTPNYEINTKSSHDSTTNKKALVGALGVLGMMLFIFLPILIIGNINSEYNQEHHVGEHTCIHCGSNDTDGYHTFWYNSGLLCNGSYEYNMTHADYTIISCNNCGTTFKYYL